MRRARAVALAVVLAIATGCHRSGGSGAAGAGGPHPEARALIEQGQYDAVLAELAGETDADAYYLLGRAWAGKAGPSATPTVALRPEEQQALDFYERAVAADPSHAGAQRALGDLLAPHALAGVEPPPSGGRKGAPTPAPATGPGTVDRVMRAYGAALQADMDDTAAVRSLIVFATRAGRLRDAEAGYEELVRRDRENPDVLVEFGDFLAGPAAKPDAALDRYAQALIWRPDDKATRLKMARLHLDAARAVLDKREYPAAEARLREAKKFAVDPASPEAAEVRELEAAVAEVRGRR